MACQHRDNRVKLICDVNHNVGRKRCWLCEDVRKESDNRIRTRNGHFRNHQWYANQECGVLHRLASGTVIGMIVICAVRQYQVRLEDANFPNDSLSQFHVRCQ